MENCSVKKRGWRTYERKWWADSHFPLFSREEISAEIKRVGGLFFILGPQTFIILRENRGESFLT